MRVLARKEMSGPPPAWLTDDGCRELTEVLVAAHAEPGTTRSLPARIRRPHVSRLGWMALGLAGVAVPANLGELDLPGVAWLAVAFADRAVTVSVGDDVDGPLVGFVRDATGARIVAVEDARLVVLAEPTEEQLARVVRGAGDGPRAATRVAMPATRLHRSGRAGEVELLLRGPGLGPGRALGVDGLDRRLAERLGRPGASFPPGFDTWLFTPQGTVAAIPCDVTVDVI